MKAVDLEQLRVSLLALYTAASARPLTPIEVRRARILYLRWAAADSLLDDTMRHAVIGLVDLGWDTGITPNANRLRVLRDSLR